MSYLTEERKAILYNEIERKFTTVLTAKIDALIGFIENVSDIRDEFPDYTESLTINNLEKAGEIINQINSLVDEQFRKADEFRFEKFFPGLIDSINSLLSIFDPLLIEEQDIGRFTPDKQDHFYLKTAKKIKRAVFDSYAETIRLRNIVAEKFKKPQSEIRYWHQIIPQRNLAYHFLRDKLLKKFINVYDDTCRLYSRSSIAFQRYDENIDYIFLNYFVPPESRIGIKTAVFTTNQLVKKLEDAKEEICERINGIIEECLIEFELACEKAGTIELNRHKFNNEKTKKSHEKIISGFESLIEGWNNNQYALGEEWKLNCDFASIRYSTLRAFYKFDKSISVRMKIQVNPPFISASDTLNKVLKELSRENSENESFIRKLRIAKEDIHSELSGSTLPGLINTVTDMQIPKMVDDTLSGIKNLFNVVTQVRKFDVSSDYNSPIKSANLRHLFPGEFLSFIALPVIAENFLKIKKDFGYELKKIQSELINLGNMVDFSIESGITAANNKELKETELKEIVIEGINISLEKNEKIQKDYKEICNNTLRKVLETIILFNAETFRFTNKSNLLETNRRFTKSKGKIVSENKKELNTILPETIPDLFPSPDDEFKNNPEIYSKLRDHPERIESDILKSPVKAADFLTRSTASMERLPYIYRRLFQISALDHHRLYLHRETEAVQLQNAFRTWLNGGFAPVIVTSERGGGKTTFINLNISRFAEQFGITRLKVNPTIYTAEKLLEMFRTIVSIESLSDYKEIIEILNKSTSRRIIVIENLQHLFLRTVNGFNALKTFLEIIAKTNKNVFWITSSSLFAFEYLSKTINLNDFFGYHIDLEEINYEQMIYLIKKRHSLSGFSLVYIPDMKAEGNKDLSKINDIEFQESLENKYFKSLSLLAGSNISLALLFWLSSVIKIKERILYLSADLEISNTLLGSLSPEKIYILHCLILHDELKLEDLSKTLNYSLYETTLLMQVLTDDGIVTKSEEFYFINPLLYRQTEAFLKSKNFLD